MKNSFLNTENRKILIVFGTRPEIVKLAPLIHGLKDSTLRDQFLVASTSQHRELQNEQLIFWKISPDFFLPATKDPSLTRLLSNTLMGLQNILDKIPTIEYIVVQGDTNTALACAQLAFLSKKKLIHIEAGLRSFDLQNPFPEEFNRIVASKVAYFHFAPTELAKQNLLAEGVHPSSIMVNGNTVIDALNAAMKDQPVSPAVERDQILITLHRRENIESNYLRLIDIIKDLSAENSQLKFTWVTHPNSSSNISSRLQDFQNIAIKDHMPYNEFIALYKSARMIITDSGGVTEEATELGIPVVVFRETTERLEPLEVNYPMIVTLDHTRIRKFFNERIVENNIQTFSYGDGKASEAIIHWLESEITQEVYDTVIVGGGPAGTGLLLKALKSGDGSWLKDQRIALIEKSSHLVRGNITDYKVNSDTLSNVFLECLEGHTNHFLDLTDLTQEIEDIKKRHNHSIPLDQLNQYFVKLGKILKTELESRGMCRFYMDSAVSNVIRQPNGSYQINFDDQRRPIKAKRLVLSMGGQPLRGMPAFDNKVFLQNFSGKYIHSDDLLRTGLSEEQRSMMESNPRVVIFGGSHSAFSAAHFLLHSKDGYNFENKSIQIWCRRDPKIYFGSKEEALAYNYHDFTEEDICPVTHKVYRLAGLRMDGRQLYMQMLGMGGVKKEERVQISKFNDRVEELEKDLREAGLIVLAFGYKLNIPSFSDHNDLPMKFKGEKDGCWVNQRCEILDASGKAIPGLYATGLATGFIPSGVQGGESSFLGQTNGIWYYQNVIAEQLITRLR